VTAYYPKKGDFVVLNFNPQSGHEQMGRRPALVISNQVFTKATGMAVVCPLTNTDRKNPFHVRVPEKTKLTGFIMVEQVKSVDFQSRQGKFVSHAPEEVVLHVQEILDACLGEA
jgi:mRNA interferase MazF